MSRAQWRELCLLIVFGAAMWLWGYLGGLPGDQRGPVAAIAGFVWGFTAVRLVQGAGKP